jgi:hypothetical protein
MRILVVMIGLSDPRVCKILRRTRNAYSLYLAYLPWSWETLPVGVAGSMPSEITHVQVEGMRDLTIRLTSSRIPGGNAEIVRAEVRITGDKPGVGGDVFSTFVLSLLEDIGD